MKQARNKEFILRLSVLIGLLLLCFYISGCAEQILCEEDNILGGGAIEAGRCAAECLDNYPYIDMRCNHIFPGDRGDCRVGEVCTTSCGCQMVDKDFDGYAGHNEDTDWLFVLSLEFGQIPVFDCDDTNSMINPGAAEVCNGIDDDCTDDAGNYDSDPETGIDDGDACNKKVYLCMEESNAREITYPFSCKNGKEWCHGDVYKSSAETFVEVKADCDFEAKAENMPADYAEGADLFIYAYYCDEKEMKCYPFNQKSFKICAVSEKCSGILNPEMNIDTDCDKLEPFWVNEDGTVDITRPKDPDCVEAVEAGALHGVCKPETKEWYDSAANEGEGGFVSGGYCQVCGDRDSSCTKLCEEDEKSCGGGCREDACDISANKSCRDGAWTDYGYASKCGLFDSDFFTEAGRDCRGNACDLVTDKTCYRSSWVTSRAGVPYCESPACKLVDFNCEASCTPGACDVDKNAYCKSDNTWSAEDADNYCSECGALDADCGTVACTETLEGDIRNCDKLAKKYCQAGEWIEEQYCEKCGSLDDSCDLACPDVWELTETDCSDGIDNNCDGDLDCMDDDCSSLDECEGACIPGRTESCGLDEALCVSGTKTCGMDGRWGSCEGATLPQPEVCNGFDDDCTGAADEGCDCTNGEIRACGRDRGSCSSGTQRCADGSWGVCHRGSRAVPTEEICDTFDNDCDGEIDEGCPCINGATQECGITEGICVKGTQTCSAGDWGSCAGEKGKLTEDSNTAGICTDNLDNDCDGKKDADDDGCTVTRTEDIAPSCTDHKKNQDEEDIDCGGSCPPCVMPANCHNRIMDPGEDGMDCGGECSVQCTERTRVRSGPSDDFDEDTEITAECGDYICDEGEEDTCPDDCAADEEPISLTSYLLPIIIALGVLGLGYFAYKKGLIKLKGQKPAKASSSFPTPKGAVKQKGEEAAFRQPQYTPAKAAPKKQFKTKEELELEKSLKEQKEMLKK